MCLVSHLYAVVAVLGENGEAALECENAMKLLKRCMTAQNIERSGARSAFLVLRHILLLHRRGISVVGLGDIELTSASFINGMKYLSKQLRGASTKRKDMSFFEQLGNSMTECIVLVKYWLSASHTERLREEAWATLALLCDILSETILSGKIEPGELGFCLHAFIGILLDPQNGVICPSVLESLKAVLQALFSNTIKQALVDGVIAVLHKLTLALLQTHQTAYEKLYSTCESGKWNW